MNAIVYQTPQEKMQALRRMVHLKEEWEDRMRQIAAEKL